MLPSLLLICVYFLGVAHCFTIAPASKPLGSISSHSSLLQQRPRQTKSPRTFLSMNMNRKKGDGDGDDDDDEKEDDDFEFARVGRRRGRGRFDDDYEDVGERTAASRDGESGTGTGTNRRDYESDYEEIDLDDEDDDDYYDSDDEDDEDDYDDIIPNALLDQIDPDGAIERLPELFSDPQFWKDSAIWFFLGFLYLLNRFNNPMLNGIVDLDKVDFTQFYNLPPTP